MQTTDFRLILGIDTGGTYTDAAICCEASGGLTLLDSAKARTTKENLTIGIRNAVSRLNPQLLRQVYRVSLSTTLATNACVEDMGGEVALVLIDKEHPSDEKIYTDSGLPSLDKIVFLPGVINAKGVVVERPSREELLAALKPVCGPGVCVAVSGIFSTRNPELELEAADVARELGAKVICGRDVAPGQLNYIRRAATALLNGRLQPVIRGFLEAVGQALRELQVDVPIDIVRSDGSLMNRTFALEYPVETLLCGPAASVSGVISLLNQQQALWTEPAAQENPGAGQGFQEHPDAQQFPQENPAVLQAPQENRTALQASQENRTVLQASQENRAALQASPKNPSATPVSQKCPAAAQAPQDYLVADIGGTTTDLSLVRSGQAVRTKDGVNIGAYRTCVQSVFVETLGLGGDTRLFVDKGGNLCLDTNRAVPLCVLAAEHPEIKEELRILTEAEDLIWKNIRIYEYRTLARQPQPEELACLSEEEKALCAFLAQGPRSITACAEKTRRDAYVFNTEHLEHLGLVRKSAFTLTDILHLEGTFAAFDREASQIIARLFCAFFKVNEPELCRKGRELASFRLYRAIVRMCIHRDHPNLRPADEAGIERMIETAFYGGSLIDTAFRLPYPLVGVGAAAAAFLPEVGERLSTTVLLPEGAAVANAIGAAASSIRAEVSREIRNDVEANLPYQVCGGSTPVSFATYEEALEEASRQAREAAIQLARDRGILGALKIDIIENRRILDTEGQYGKISFDFGGIVVATAEAEVVTEVIQPS